MQWPRKITVGFLLIAILMSACSIKFGGKDLDEGILMYNITYLIDETENPVISLMPSFITMKFKHNAVVLEMEGWMGVFKSSFIKSSENNQAITLLKMMKQKYSYHSPPNQGYLGFAAYDQMEIKFDNEIKSILDLECKHAVVSLKNKNLVFDIYYTEEIKIERPNEFTPFAQVPGVLMEFQIEINGIPMYLIATDLNDTEISDDVFIVPSDYEEVAREELDKIFSSII